MEVVTTTTAAPSINNKTKQKTLDDAASVTDRTVSTVTSLGTSSSLEDDFQQQQQYCPTQSAVAQQALQQLQARLADRGCTNLQLESMKEKFDRSVLAQFYEELMIPNFPLEEERDDLDDWLLYLDPNQGHDISQEGPSMDVLILQDASPGSSSKIIGGIAFEYYPQAQAGLLSYMVVSADYRRKGILATLHPVFCHAVQELHQVASTTTSRIKAILAETNTVTAGDVPPAVARKRHEILYRLGYRQLEFPYVQPPLATDVESFDDIMLLVYAGDTTSADDNNNNTEQTTISTQVLYHYVLDFYHSVFGHDNDAAFQDHWYYRLVTWFNQHHPATQIKQNLPWEDVTPHFQQAMNSSEHTYSRGLTPTTISSSNRQQQQRLVGKRQ